MKELKELIEDQESLLLELEQRANISPPKRRHHIMTAIINIRTAVKDLKKADQEFS